MHAKLSCPWMFRMMHDYILVTPYFLVEMHTFFLFIWKNLALFFWCVYTFLFYLYASIFLLMWISTSTYWKPFKKKILMQWWRNFLNGFFFLKSHVNIDTYYMVLWLCTIFWAPELHVWLTVFDSYVYWRQTYVFCEDNSNSAVAIRVINTKSYRGSNLSIL